MYWGLDNNFLYAALKLQVTFADDIGDEVTAVGTGFWLRHSGQVCVVTNRHVVDIDYRQPTAKYRNYKVKMVQLHFKQPDPTTGLPDVDQVITVIAGTIEHHDDDKNDVACIFVDKLNAKVLPINIEYHVESTFLASRSEFSSGLNVGDFVMFPGFPAWHDQDANRPIMRVGTIASDPRFNYRHSAGGRRLEGECVAYEAFSSGGSSGSPVFALELGLKGAVKTSKHRRLLLAGVNAGHLDNHENHGHSGISYFYKSYVVLETVEVFMKRKAAEESPPSDGTP